MKVEQYTASPRECCTVCGSELGDDGAWYVDRKRMCRQCWQMAHGDDGDSLGLFVAMRNVLVFYAVVAMVVAWLWRWFFS